MKGVKIPDRIYRTDDRSRVWVGKFIRPEQEEAIVRTMSEPTQASIWGSEMDTGKTLCAAEFVIRKGFERVLVIGVKDTYGQWAGRLHAQSEGAIELRRIDGSAPGKRALAAFLAGEKGHYFAGSQYLAAQDWELRDVYVQRKFGDNPPRKYREWQRDKKTGAVLTKPREATTLVDRFEGEVGPAEVPRPVVGPAEVPIPARRRHHLDRYKKMKVPVDLVLFDEIHMVANRKSNGNGTLRSIPRHWFLGMSGTWVGNKFENAHAIAFAAWPDLIDPSIVRWRSEWCSTEVARKKGGQPVTDARGNPIETVSGEKVPGAFVKTLPCYIRLKDPLGKVPAPEVFEVDMHPQQALDYAALEEDGLVWLAQRSRSLAPVVTNLPIVKRTRLRTAALGTMGLDADGDIWFPDDTQSSVLWALRIVVEHEDWRNRQVGIYTHSKRFADVTVRRMRAAGYDARLWSGDVSSTQRDELKRAWLAGEFPFLVSVISAFSTGLDGFQDVCNRVVWLSEEDNNYLNQQAIKRYFRSGNPQMLADFRHVKIIPRNTLAAGVFAGNSFKTSVMADTLHIDMPAAA